MPSHATKPNIVFPLKPGWEIMNGKRVPVHIKGSMAPELMEDLMYFQSIVHAVRTVCIAQICARVIAMQIPHSIGDQDALSGYHGDGDGDDSDNGS